MEEDEHCLLDEAIDCTMSPRDSILVARTSAHPVAFFVSSFLTELSYQVGPDCDLVFIIIGY